MSYNEFSSNTDISLTLHSELSISVTEHYMSLQHEEKSSFLFPFRSWFVNFIKGKSYTHYKWIPPLSFLLCGMLILFLKRNRFCLLLILSMFSLCTSLHTGQGDSYFSHSFHASAFQLKEWFYKAYVLKSAKN